MAHKIRLTHNKIEKKLAPRKAKGKVKVVVASGEVLDPQRFEEIRETITVPPEPIPVFHQPRTEIAVTEINTLTPGAFVIVQWFDEGTRFAGGRVEKTWLRKRTKHGDVVKEHEEKHDYVDVQIFPALQRARSITLEARGRHFMVGPVEHTLLVPSEKERESIVQAERLSAVAQETQRTVREGRPSPPRRKGTVVSEKTAKVLELMKRPGGAIMEELVAATGWLANSVSGFISGVIKKQLGQPVVREKNKKGVRTYAIKEGK